ncbi:MAG: hypothetical protein UU21_C0008G0003 [Candidatus Levybacteria bacterium GW2011_GWA2_40_8]|nr:MAG: hypothetical protein UU21_C0008G0003 [Candidatus Levybacteria bacterium GW2011_GWA2_40_8]
MSNLEIQRENRGRIVERIADNVPDENGRWATTAMGDIAVEILEWDLHGLPKKIKLEGEAMRGTPKKHWWRRKESRTIALNHGMGAQRISKREVLIVRPDIIDWRREPAVGERPKLRPYDVHGGTGNPI